MSAPIGPYSPIVRAGEWLVTSGQLGLVDGRIVPGGIRHETEQALANLQELLQSAGAGLTDVVKATVFLRHMRDYPIVNEVWTTAFGDHRPARTALAVAELPLHALIEIEVWARPGGSNR